jgi:transposase
MILEQFWLTDAQFAKIAPHPPTDTRGKARVNDHRLISGIVQVLKSGGRWVDAPPEYGPKKTLYNRYVRWAEKGVWVDLSRLGAGRRAVRASSHRQLCGEGASLGLRGKRGEKNQALGRLPRDKQGESPSLKANGPSPRLSRHSRSRGGRTTKIHALTDAACRPLAFMLTGGNVADCTAGAELLARLPPCEILQGDEGYDSNAILRQVEAGGAAPNIPPKANCKWKNCFSPFLYRKRNAIERIFCRLKDFRRVATRYDRNAANFLAAVCIAAVVSYWL